MYQRINAAVLNGIESLPVKVEADVTNGLPVFELVGFVSSEVKEARERIRSAFLNSGFKLPSKRITINISPADKRKRGSALDLPMAVALLLASGLIEVKDSMQMEKDVLIVGELGLNGDVRPINGVLSIVIAARQNGMKRCIVPHENAAEARLVSDMEIIPASSLDEAVLYLTGKKEPIAVTKTETANRVQRNSIVDFADINGQAFLKRACEVAAAGRHNILFIGSPGAGKTLAAKAIASILPGMTLEEQLEVSRIYSAMGMLDADNGLINARPFRAPHHTITTAALTGGGSIPHPGELSLAHGGVLFLDELTEFARQTVEVLRQPLEEHVIRINRVNTECTFPADIMLVAAMNPCPCGEYPDLNRCNCREGAIRAYQGRVSKPLRDRIDICISVPRVGYDELTRHDDNNESSDSIRSRVEEVWKMQQDRYKDIGIRFNSQIPVGELDRYCALNNKTDKYAKDIYERLKLTARGYHKLLRVARTIADLSNDKDIGIKHLTEAVCYRDIDTSFIGED